MPRRWQRWVLGIAVVLIAVAFGLAHQLDEPLRRRIEAGINRSLEGYQVTIGRVDFHPLGFSLDLEDSVIVQEAHPDPPVAEVPLLSASVEWLSLLQSELVADFEIVEPKLHIDQKQGEKEFNDGVSIRNCRHGHLERHQPQAAREKSGPLMTALRR